MSGGRHVLRAPKPARRASRRVDVLVVLVVVLLGVGGLSAMLLLAPLGPAW